MHGIAQAGDGARVGKGAGSAEAVEGLVAAERGDEVRGERVPRRPAVARGAVPAEAGAVVEVRREEAAEEPVVGLRHRHPGAGAALVGHYHYI